MASPRVTATVLRVRRNAGTDHPINPNAGHVAFFVERRSSFIDVLGGNQGNSVKISSYRAEDLMSYRWNNRTNTIDQPIIAAP